MASGKPIIPMELDTQPLREYLAKLSEQLPHISLEAREKLLSFFESGSELVRFESAAAAGTVKLTLHPSDALLEFVSTVRAS